MGAKSALFIAVLFLALTCKDSFAEPAEGTELEDIVCAATLPCSPPAFEVFEGFKSGPCAKVYRLACDRWKETKAKAEALDIAAAKLLQCMQDKKKPKSSRK